ncbi:MAG: cardiolipin synthase [Eubacteriales bacterium]|nr:cardiolipin synthase [Eubacteriales bacterium]
MKERKPSGNSILRIVFVAVSFLLQIAWLLTLTIKLNAYSTALSLMTTILSLLVVLRLNSKYTNTAMKMPWIMLILVLPVMGLSMYLLVEILGDPGVGKRLRSVRADMKDEIPAGADATVRKMEEIDLPAANQARYLWNCVRWPVYENTDVRFFAEAKYAFEAMKADLEKAEKFIFMEYFIVEDSSCFREIEDILTRKQAQGVEVRFLYDDIGSVGKVNMFFARRLNEEGIACRPFNPALPLLNIFLNHRDHRKITVIDGKVGFTGGYNLAEEYFDRKHPYGQWKDTGLRLEGEAVRSLTAAFLELWGVQQSQREDYRKYLDIVHSVPASGFVQPFADDPLGQERAAEEVYLNLTSQSNKTLYFMTPYLIITDEMHRALCLAAKRGVDVRIITPGIPDKKLIYAVTRSYYAGLVAHGVRIYEYTPGFCHAKQCICDGRIATVGTSNLDYRSLYHHFENNVVLYGCDAVQDIAADFENTFPQCREVTEQYRAGRGAMLRTWQYILRLFAPLM